MATLVFSDQFLTTTLMYRVEKMRSMIDRPLRFLDDMLAMGKDEVAGGERVLISWKFGRHANNTQLSTGYEPLNLSVSPIGTPGHDSWFYVQRPILYSGREDTLNRDKHKVISIIESRGEDTELGLKADVEDEALRGDVPTMSDLNTLNGTDDATGFLEEDIVGSQTNTVHNTSKATYATAAYFQNQTSDIANSFSANGLTSLFKAHIRSEDLAQEPSKIIGYGSLSLMEHLKRAVQTNERYVSESNDAGQPVMSFGGRKLRVTSRLPNSGVNTTAQKWSLVFIDWSALRFVAQKGKCFSLTPFREISGYDVRAAFMNIFGQLCAPKGFGSHTLVVRGESW